jgi:hypothetical protein
VNRPSSVDRVLRRQSWLRSAAAGPPRNPDRLFFWPPSSGLMNRDERGELDLLAATISSNRDKQRWHTHTRQTFPRHLARASQ